MEGQKMNTWKHKTETVKFLTEPSELPVAMVTGKLIVGRTGLDGVTIPLQEFNDKIVNAPDWWELQEPIGPIE